MSEQEFIEFKAVFEEWLKQNKKNIPNRVVDTNVNKILKAYAREYRELLNYLLANIDDLLENDATKALEIEATLRQFEERINQITGTVSTEVTKGITQAYLTGILLDNTDFISFDKVNTYKAEQLIKDTMEDLLYATENTKRGVKKVIRDIVAKQVQLNALKAEHSEEVAKAILAQLSKKAIQERLKKEGFIGIIDSAGRKWNLKTYIDMVVRTKNNQAYHEGLKDSMDIRATDLARVSTHKADDACVNFEGLIISMRGETKGYLTYDELKATGMIFHPNCKHNCYPVNKIELLHEDYIKIHEAQSKKLKELLKKSKRKSSKK